MLIAQEITAVAVATMLSLGGIGLAAADEPAPPPASVVPQNAMPAPYTPRYRSVDDRRRMARRLRITGASMMAAGVASFIIGGALTVVGTRNNTNPNCDGVGFIGSCSRSNYNGEMIGGLVMLVHGAMATPTGGALFAAGTVEQSRTRYAISPTGFALTF